jgi:hypothetical protein
MSERSAHDPVHDAATPREAILVGRAEVRDLVELFTGELTSREAAAPAGVDRSTIMTLRKTAQGWSHRRVAGVAAGSAPGCPRGRRGGPREGGEHPAVGHDRGRLGELTNVW